MRLPILNGQMKVSMKQSQPRCFIIILKMNFYKKKKKIK